MHTLNLGLVFAANGASLNLEIGELFCFNFLVVVFPHPMEVAVQYFKIVWI